jgi:hypothetical protein
MLSIKKAGSIKKYTLLSLCLLFLFCVVPHAEAATLNATPSTGTTEVGKTFTVRISVDSSGQSINAVSGQIHFPNNLVTLSNISKSGIVTLWAQDPTYSNASGIASFQGVILNGYTGTSGTIVTLTFKAKAEGVATISIVDSGSSVLLNDGQGTDILSATHGSSFTINQAPVETTPPQTPPPETTMPQTPETVVSPAPTFTDYQSPLLSGNFVVVKGTAPANTVVNIAFTHIAYDGTTNVTTIPIATTDNGTFTFVSDQKVTEGSRYTLIATTQDGQTTTSLSLKVQNSLWFVFSMWIASIIAIKISVVFALLWLLLITGYLLYRNRILRKRLRESENHVRNSQIK